MLLPSEDAPKRRLTEQSELKVAAEFLIAHGFDDDEIAVQLSRFYYVDIDALNEAIAGLSRGGETVHRAWRGVA